MITPEAIEKLEQAKTLQQAQAAITMAGLDGELIALPATFNLHDMEKFHDGRRNFRGVMSTPVPDHYFKYCKAWASGSGASCFVDPDAMQAATIFDLGDEEGPGHARHRATLALQKTAEYLALLQAARQAHKQKELAEWMEDWRECLMTFDADDKLMDIKQAISAVRSIDIKSVRNVGSTVQNLSASRSTMEEARVESQHVLPSAITFSCEPYQGLEARTFHLRLSALTGGDELKLSLTIRQHEKAVQEMADEFAELIQDNLDTLPVYVGTYDAK